MDVAGMKEPAGELRKLSVREVLNSINEAALSLSSEFEEIKEVHGEVHRLFTRYSDGKDDQLALMLLDDITLQISSLFLNFSKIHLQTVQRLTTLDAALHQKDVAESEWEHALRQANEVKVNYLTCMSDLTRMKKSFIESSSHFLFPQRKSTR